MVMDSELVCRLREIVRCCDLRTTTAAAVRRRLEEEVAVDLYDRRAFINQQIDIFLQSVAPRCDDRETGEVDENVRNGVVENQIACDRDQATSEQKEGDNYEIGQRKRRCTVMKAKKKKTGGICKPRTLSPQLQKLLGVSELAWPEVVKKLWAYIRAKNLQDPKCGRRILCDESLRGIFNAESVEAFQMSKELGKHVWQPDETRATRIKPRNKKQGRQIVKV